MDIMFKGCRFQASVMVRDKEVGFRTIIQACFNPCPIIKGPSFWSLDFGFMETDTYLIYDLLQSVLIASFHLSSSWYIKYYISFSL